MPDAPRRRPPTRRRPPVTAQQVRRMGAVLALCGALTTVGCGLLLAVALHWLPRTSPSADAVAGLEHEAPPEAYFIVGAGLAAGIITLALGLWHVGPGTHRRQALLDALQLDPRSDDRP